MRKLASIQIVEELLPIEGAYNIESIRVLGWRLISKKGEFAVGDKCVFFEIDSILPETEWSEFLRPKKFTVKTLKLNNKTLKFGVISQGLALPLKGILPEGEYNVGDDVTELIGVTKHDPYEEKRDGIQGDIKGVLPFWIIKTDEDRIQSAPWILKEMSGKPAYVTMKYDGMSATFYYDEGEFNVASRSLSRKRGNNVFWNIATKYNIEEVLREQQHLVLQGELVGPKANGNRLGLTEYDLFIFNIFDKDKREYWGFHEIQEFCDKHSLKMVEAVAIIESFDYDIPKLEAMSVGFYANGFPMEGIVVRPIQAEFSPFLGRLLSFKCINKEYLLKVK